MLPRSNNPDNSLVGHAVTAMAKQALRADLPRLFTIEYDCTKLKSKNAWSRAEFARRIECEGTLYTNGRVTLDTGVVFKHVAEMKEHYDVMGKYVIRWSNGEEESN